MVELALTPNDSLSGPNAGRREGRDGGESCAGG
jgi:hypothetical protein